MAQANDIRPLSAADLPELSQILTSGFQTSADASFAAVDVLNWKYLDPRGADAGDAPRSYVACDLEKGQIVGHVGVCPGRFRGPGIPPEGISTLHMIDWLSSQAGVGATLMRLAHQASDTQFGFGGSAAGRKVGDRGGYGLVAHVPVYHNVLRPSYRFRVTGSGYIARVLRTAKDTAVKLKHRASRPSVALEIKQVSTFGEEIAPILEAYSERALFTSREPELLNHMLRYPHGGMSGWQLLVDGRLQGYALLALVPQAGGIMVGKVVDCLLDLERDDLWHAALFHLTRQLKTMKADLVVAFASNEWSARALKASGYARVHDLEFRLRDRSGKIPRDLPFHLTPLEADYAYT